ncbi:MAG: nucleoside deaminase [Pacificimonas sp.]
MIYRSDVWNAVLDAARKSFADGNGGIGAAVVGPDGRVLSVAGNATDARGAGLEGTPLAHAETMALQPLKGDAAAKSTLYASLQPCPMCHGAALWAEVAEIVYLVPDPRWPLPYTSDLDPEAELKIPTFRQIPWRAESEEAAVLALAGFRRVMDDEAFGFYARAFPGLMGRVEVLLDN